MTKDLPGTQGIGTQDKRTHSNTQKDICHIGKKHTNGQWAIGSRGDTSEHKDFGPSIELGGTPTV